MERVKVIKIFGENLHKGITLIDKDETPISVYTKKLTKLIENNNIVIIYTKGKNVILRPSKIDAITIIEEDENINDKNIETITSIEPLQTEVKSKVKEDEDIITDGENE